jgi:GTP-binding protein
MAKPLVAIVGRPNVGKSTLFNRLVGGRKAIVVDTPGATRDRNYGEVTWRGRAFAVVDTGGFEPLISEGIGVDVREHARLAIEEADLTVLLLDGQSGLTPDDKELAEILRRWERPLVIAINKIDSQRHEERLYEFYALGIELLYPVSAEHGRGVGELLDTIIEHVPEAAAEEAPEEGVIRFAVVGRPNVGKSSLVNKLLGMERTLVSETPGTTRDAIDTAFFFDERPFVAIDTAGIRRKARVKERVEAYSVLRALKSLGRCDVACLLIDGTEGVTDQDARIAGYTEEAGRGLVLVVNKWDLVEKDTSTTGQWVKNIRDEMPFVAYAPVLFVSALTGQRVQRLLPAVEAVASQHRRRISTSELNACIEKAWSRHHPPQFRGRQVKAYYAAQVGTSPPRFALVVNHPRGLTVAYRRYLVNRIRDAFGFEGTPLKVRVRPRRRRGPRAATPQTHPSQAP